MCSIDSKDLYSMIDEAVISICEDLHAQGKECYLVGGATRDLLMGEKPKDWDLTTDATPDEVMEIFHGEKIVPTGLQHGTVTLIRGDEPYEITTFRTEGAYSDGRRPDYVRFTDDIREDLKRRDLTINSIAYSPMDDRIVTTEENGIEDLRNGVIRAVGDAGERFREDGLRTMRVCRFASRLNFDVEEETLRAVRENVGMIDKVSEERIREEIMGILKQSDKPSIGIECLRKTGLLEKVLPEVADLYGLEQAPQYHKYDAYWHTNVGLDSIPKEKYIERLEFLLHDIGKKPARAWSDSKQRYAYIDHDILGAEMASAVMERLKFSTAVSDRVVRVVRNHLLHDSSQWSDKSIRKLVNKVGEENLEDLLTVHRADIVGKGMDIDKYLREADILEDRLQRLREETGKVSFTAKDLAITGHDVMNYLQITPGPMVGRVLNHMVEKVMDDPSLNNRGDLMKMLEEVEHNE